MSNNISKKFAPRVFPKPQVSNGKASGYIIMPPEQNSLFKSEGAAPPTLDSFGVTKTEKLDFIGGEIADLSPEQVKDMEKSGYKVFKDEVRNYIPKTGLTEMKDLSAIADSAVEEFYAGKEGELPAPAPEGEGQSIFKPREEMTVSRFDSPIENLSRGEGVTIAVLDSGVAMHTDIKDRVIGQIDFINGYPMPYDDNGHGTHVAGDAAGAGIINPAFAGPASKANILSMKVLSGQGSGSTSGIVRAIQTAVELKEDLSIKVINMSLGGPASKNGESDPINMAIKAAKEAGITVVVAAGNEGPGRSTVGSPGNSLHAITVGATDDNNTLDPSDDKPAPFSSRGPTPDDVSKPDIMAPGVTIMSALSQTSAAADRARQMQGVHRSLQGLDNLPFAQLQTLPDELFASVGIGPETAAKMKLLEPISDLVFDKLLTATSSTPLDETGAYIGMPGTSMATPIVAGVAAQMLGANPDLTPDQVKEILTSTADKLPDGRLGKNTQGAGVVDPKEAIDVALKTEGARVEEAELSFEEQLAALLPEGTTLADLPIFGEEPAEAPAEDAPAEEAPAEDKTLA